MIVVELQNVISCVEHACYSSNPPLQQSAMRKLQEFENYDNFLDSLLHIIRNREFVVDGRLLASICLKNLVNRCWSNRNNSSRAITQNEKTTLKRFLLQYLDESNTKVSVQLAVITSKVARHDWPNDWPELFNVLFQEVSQGEFIRRLRSMSVLSLVLEELTSKRMRSNKESFNIIATQMFPVMVPVWREISTHIISMLPSLGQRPYPAERDLQTEALCQHLYNTLRVLHRLLLSGYRSICRQAEVMAFFEELSTHLMRMADFLRGNYRPQFSEDDEDFEEEEEGGDGEDGAGGGGAAEPVWRPNTDGVVVLNFLLRRVVRRMVQLPVDLQRIHPLPLASALAPFLALYRFLLDQEVVGECSLGIESGPSHRLQRTLLMASVLFLSNVLSCRAYVDPPLETPRRLSSSPRDRDHEIWGAKGLEESGEDDRLGWFRSAHDTLEAFFTDGFVADLLGLLLQRLLLLREAELFLWRTEPEEFVCRLQAEVEADSVRTAAEGLFLGILDKAPQVVIPRLLQLLSDQDSQLSAVRTGAPANEVLMWDAVYLCAGLGVAELSRSEGTAAEEAGVGSDGSLEITVDDEEPSRRATPGWISEAMGPALLALTANESSDGGGSSGCVSGCPVLKRRMFWALHCWAFTLDADAVALVLRLLVEEICREPADGGAAVGAGGGGTDLVTKLEALDTLAAFLSVPVFEPSMLVDQVNAAVRGLCMLSIRLEQSTFRARAVEVVGELVLAMGTFLRPSLQALVLHLCSLWSSSEAIGASEDEADGPMRPAILETLARVVRVGRSESIGLMRQLLPLVSQVVAAGDDEVCGFGDALSLWLAVLRNTPSHQYSSDLNDLFNRCVSSWLARGEAAHSQQVTRDLLLLCQAYAVVGAETFFRACSLHLFQLLGWLLEQLSARSVAWVIRPVEALLLSCPPSLVVAAMSETGLTQRILRACAAGIDDPILSAFTDFAEADIAVIEYLHVLARAMRVEARPMLQAAAEELAASVGISGKAVVLAVIRLFLDKFDALGGGGVASARRKAWVMLLLSLYPTDDETVASWFPEVLVAVDSVVCELSSDDVEELDAGSLALELLSFEEGALDEAGGDPSDGEEQATTGEAKGEPAVERLTQLLVADVMMATSQDILQAARHALVGMRDVLGGDRLQALLVSIDPSTTHRLFEDNGKMNSVSGGSSSHAFNSPPPPPPLSPVQQWGSSAPPPLY